MSDPERPEIKPEEAVVEAKAEHKKPKKQDVFHPRRHGHVVIGVPSTGVSHIDPGVVTFS